MFGVICLFFLFLFILFAAASLLYYIIYKRSINRHLNEEIPYRKKLISPLWMTLVFFIGILILFALGSVVFNFTDKEELDQRYYDAMYDYHAYTKEDAESGWLANYSIEENEGYAKRVETIDDIRFTIFVNQDSFDTFHPAFLVYAEYLKDDELMVDFKGDFLTETGMEICGMGATGGYTADYILFVGNASIDCIFSLTIHLFDESSVTKEDMIELDKIEEAALSSATVLIDIAHK